MVQEAVNDGVGRRHIAQVFAPFFQRPVTGHDGGTIFVAAHDHFQQVSTKCLWSGIAGLVVGVHAAADTLGYLLALKVTAARVFVAVKPCEMRKGLNGLYADVTERLGENPKGVAFIVLCTRRRSRIKILYWDQTRL